MKLLYVVAGVLCFAMGYSMKCECTPNKKCLCKKSYSLVEVKRNSSVIKEAIVQNHSPRKEEEVEEVQSDNEKEEKPEEDFEQPKQEEQEKAEGNQIEEIPKVEEPIAMIQKNENKFLKRS